MQQIALYIHWPFCKAKCPYCDFNSHVSSHIDHTLWQESYIKELQYFHDYLSDKQINSIFFGGGTPSLAEPRVFAAILEHLNQYRLADNIEITLEANPTSVERQRLASLAAIGINRLSLGVQSLRPARLKFLGREHDVDDVKEAISLASHYFKRYSFDLIYATPDQSLDAWLEELQEALLLVRDHISLYQLTIEKGTPFWRAHQQKQFVMPSDDLAANMYDATETLLKEYNLFAYEVSNYAALGQESQHNLAYWQYMDYLGIGPGAHGRITINGIKHATIMRHAPNDWLQHVNENGVGYQKLEALSDKDIWEEKVMVGLRLRSGVEESLLSNVADKVNNMIKEGILERGNGRISIAPAYRLLLNKVLEQLL